MTSKEYTQISEFYSKHYNLQMRGHIWLFPKAVRHIPCASYTVKQWAYKKDVIYLKPIKMRIDGENIRIQDAHNGMMSIHRKWIQSVLLYHFNH